MNTDLKKLWIKKFALFHLWYYKGAYRFDLSLYKQYFYDINEWNIIENYIEKSPVLRNFKDMSRDEINNYMNSFDEEVDKNNDLLIQLRNVNDEKIKSFSSNKDIDNIETFLCATKDFFLSHNSYEETAYTLISYFSEKYNDFSEEQKNEVYRRWKNELEDYKKHDSIERDGELVPFTYRFWSKSLESPYYVDYERYEFIKKYSYLGFQSVIDEIYNDTNEEISSSEISQKIGMIFDLSFYKIMFKELRNLVEQQVNIIVKKVEKEKFIMIQHPDLNYKFVPSIISTAQLVKIVLSEYYLSERHKEFIANSINWIIDNQTSEGFWRPYLSSDIRNDEEFTIDTTITCLYILNICGLPGTEYARKMAKKWLADQIGELGIWNLKYPDSVFYMLLGYTALSESEKSVSIAQRSDFIVKSHLLLDKAKEHFSNMTEVDYGIALMLLQQSLEFFSYEIIYNIQGTYFKKTSVLGLMGADGALTKIDAFFKEKKLLNSSQPLPYRSKIEEMSYYRDEFTHKGVVPCNHNRIQEYFDAVSLFKDYCITQLKAIGITINH